MNIDDLTGPLAPTTKFKDCSPEDQAAIMSIVRDFSKPLRHALPELKDSSQEILEECILTLWQRGFLAFEETETGVIPCVYCKDLDRYLPVPKID